jgi:hypothetical protein
MYLETLMCADKARVNADNYGEAQQTEAMELAAINISHCHGRAVQMFAKISAVAQPAEGAAFRSL